MNRTKRAPKMKSDRAALRRRVVAMIRGLNSADWERCYETIDPKLRDKGTPEAKRCAQQLRAFRDIYGEIVPWHTRINLHLDASTNKHDARPFAYVYIVWQDAAKEFHIFRERWVKDKDQWYTRVVGLVPGKATS
jgi:hypothetical protein